MGYKYELLHCPDEMETYQHNETHPILRLTKKHVGSILHTDHDCEDVNDSSPSP